MEATQAPVRASPWLAGQRNRASSEVYRGAARAVDEAFYPALEIGGPGGHLGGFIACGGEGAVPGTTRALTRSGMIAPSVRPYRRRPWNDPRARRFDPHSFSTAMTSAACLRRGCRLVMRFRPVAVPASVPNQDEAMGLTSPATYPVSRQRSPDPVRPW